MTENKTYYVYAWYLKSTNKVFHIGKGTKNRYLNTTNSRNKYFKNIIQNYPDDVAVKKLVENLTNEEACQLEKQLIAEYKAKGECETNFHEGGCGGNTGNYQSPERHEKLSEFAKTRIGEKNSNFGNKWTEEQKRLQSEKLKEAWQDPTTRGKFLANRENVGWKPGTIPWNKDKTYSLGNMSDEHYLKMMNVDCKYKYEVHLEGKLIYWCLGRTKLINFIKEEFNLSRTIIEQVIDGNWQPKFNKHLKYKTLQINKILRDTDTFETVVEERLI